MEESKKYGFTKTAGSILSEETSSDATDPHRFLTDGVLSRTDFLVQCLESAIGQYRRKNRK